jgi:hypothetical protein
LIADKAVPLINVRVAEFLGDGNFSENLSISNIKDTVQLYISHNNKRF